MTYSGNPGTSPKDEVRFLLADTSNDANTEKLTDDEIEWALTKHPGNIPRAAMQCVINIIASLTGDVSVTVGDTSVSSGGEEAEHWKALIPYLEAQGGKLPLPVGPPVSTDDFKGGLPLSDFIDVEGGEG